MVKKMNKIKFINKLKSETAYTEESCILINKTLERNCIIGKRNKQKIIDELILKNFTEDEAENIYDISINIIINEIKNKLKHPFKNLD